MSPRRTRPVVLICSVHGADDIAGRGEADAFVAAGLRRDGGVDADQPSTQIDEWSAAAARVDRGIGLNPDHGRFRFQLARHGADDTERDRVHQPERAAEREHQLTRFQLVRVGERNGGQLVAVDLDDGKIRLEIHADNLRADDVGRGSEKGRAGCRPGNLHANATGAAHDVCVGDDVAGRIDDDARAGGTLGPDQIAAPRHEPVTSRVGGREDLDDRRTDVARGGLERGAELRGGLRHGRGSCLGWRRCGCHREDQGSRGAEDLFPAHGEHPF